MKKTCLAGVLLAASATALAYPVEMDFERNGLDVHAEVSQVGEQTIVMLTNGEGFPVRCEAVFRNGPEQSRARRVVLEAGDSRPLNFSPQRSVVRMRVEVWCESTLAVSPGD